MVAVVVAVVVPFEVVGPCCTAVGTSWGMAHMAIGAEVGTDAVAIDICFSSSISTTLAHSDYFPLSRCKSSCLFLRSCSWYFLSSCSARASHSALVIHSFR